MQPPTTIQGNPMPTLLTTALDTVTIRLKSDVVITVHKGSLSAVSSYFERAFDGPFIEADQRTITLSDVSEPTFRIFLQWANMQVFRSNPTVEALCEESLLSKTAETSLLHATSLAGANLNESSDDVEDNGDYAFDEEEFHLESGSSEELNELFYSKQDWLANYSRVCLPVVQLYIFADKYEVPQLRDDVLTAYLGFCHKMGWLPGPDYPGEELIFHMCDNLPASSSMVRFTALCTALEWLPVVDGICATKDCATKMRALFDLHYEFAFQVSVSMAEVIRKHYESAREDRAIHFEDYAPNACPFHEHTDLDKEKCRLRIKERPEIFAAILDACMQELRSTATNLS
jgi:hypothetical protein